MTQDHDEDPGAGRDAVLSEVKLVRRAAARVLHQLLIDRQLIEQRHAESGETDPLKRVRGRSALDGAIDTTRLILRDIDALDRQVDAESITTRAGRANAPVPVGS